MTILLMQPAIITDTNSNGGRLSDALVVTTVGGAGNFTAVSKSEGLAGVTKYRKLFIKIADALNPVAVRAVVFLAHTNLLAESRAFLMAGTQRDQQGAIAGRKYSTGKLNANVSAMATVLVVDFATGSAADLVVQAGDTLIIKEGVVEDYALTVASVAWVGEQATITLTTGVVTAFTSSAFVGSCLVDTAHINTKFDNVLKSFIASSYDLVAYPIITNNIGTDEETLTFTITGSTTFSVLSDRHGVLPSGSTLSDYSPIHAVFGVPYFTLSAAGWGGTHTIGESMQVQIHPAALPVWVCQESFAGIDAGTNAAYPSVRLEM